ncbi:FAD-dependent monooxygenase [Methylobacterium gnaphalii]|uniref:2-octaprenyl-6-methoxyphenyl hydroxylase n=1 Tax=Methylobacterium gnaphalii TaxID=1010610 RepID=A0A512JPQ8_9HYPH|nr:FAD-dependent monooxygenase [Methylobacterium gnaphalii]GEP11927.1 2-octaprenyl-6-methoxyphenyl hydroxylase [Methylobacterium gnaphalii]GJD68453.1 Ubiquinone hydroxylase UbiL [Methylobacterium gnaphalii]GLS48623.1 2-octaprenyl-6-methoxyphenyl hydroxylase [Methylobacterium gnaphalii]
MKGSVSRRGSRGLIVAGAGIPGLTLALALKQANGEAIDITVCDPGLSAGAARHRGRAYAVAAGPRRMFGQLGLWERIAPAAEAILDMAITDSRLADPVRPTFLTFAQGDEAADGEPFAHMVEAEPLVETLLTASRETGITFEGTGIATAIPERDRIRATLGDGRELAASLIVAADGARSRLREAAGIGWVGWSYPQAGIVATIAHEREHEGRAYEHFLPSGPFAILPLPDRNGRHRSSIVWTERQADVAALLGGEPEDTLAEIERRFGLKLGRLTLEDGPSTHPLNFGIARAFRGDRLALLGDAAHVIHPVAGQGLNLGLAGAAALAEAVTEALRLGTDPGAPEVLRAYERARRFDTVAMAAATDGLNRLFSNDALPVRLARDLGLGLVERLPSLKRFFIGEASTSRGAQPRLLRGEAL